MTRFTLSMMEQHWHHLLAGSGGAEDEKGAVLFCRTSVTPVETRLIVQEVEHIESFHVLERSPQHLAIHSQTYVNALAKADRNGQVIVCVHSHPGGYAEYSKQDDQDEAELFRTAYIRNLHGPHGSMIIVGQANPVLIGRVWLEAGEVVPIERIRIVGSHMRFFDRDADDEQLPPPWATRQVEAFGRSYQNLLKQLHIGVVGVGGTGSAICEQLIRMGIGTLTVCDHDIFDDSNVNRVYGSGLKTTSGLLKVDIVELQAQRIGTDTRVIRIPQPIANVEAARALCDCDLVFGCTDDLLGRSILSRLAVWYYIPVIDMGVHVDSIEQQIRQVAGRVTILMPGSACLNCRDAIPPDKLQAEVLHKFNPSDYESQRKLGYVADLNISNPSVVMFTGGIANRAMMEFLHLLTGFMGSDRKITEMLELFDQTEIGSNTRTGKLGCFCSTPEKWGRADENLFLGMTWATPLDNYVPVLWSS